MTGLRLLAADYLRLRRALGYRLVEHERFLGQFLDHLEQVNARTITVEHALTWARLPQDTSPRWHAVRLSAVRGFAAWALTIDPAVQVPPSGLLPWCSSRATPYLYSTDQLDALLGAAADLSPALRAATYQALIGLLAVTGMRVGEVIRSDVKDLDLATGTLTVRGSKFGKSRQLPLHPSTTDALRRYLRRRSRSTAITPALLVSTAGTRLTYSNVHRTFAQLTARAGIGPRSTASRPRIHDLRHTFAVNTLLEAYQSGAEPAVRLPLLSTYLGHTEPANTYWYLHAAPELLALAADRLEQHHANATS